jgi:hypothetical protein
MVTRQRALAASVRLASPGLPAADGADGHGAAPGPGGMTTLLAFRKIGIKSRVELTRVAVRRSTDSQQGGADTG